MLRLGVLELGLNTGPDQADHLVIDQLLELAPKLEELGYHRLWIGEHQDEGVAWRNTEVLITILAGLTERIRIGAAGVLLYLQSPLRIAQHFRMLNYLYADRIDLGLARGKSMDATINAILQQSSEADLSLGHYQDKLTKLIRFFEDQNVTVPPQFSGRPDVWILGTGTNSVALAIEQQLAYSFSMFHPFSRTESTAEILQEYALKFQDKYQKTANYNIAVAGVCAETEQEAIRIKNSLGRPFPVPMIVGNPSQCREQLLSLQKQLGVSEVIFSDISYYPQDKVNSYGLLAESMQLESAHFQGQELSSTIL